MAFHLLPLLYKAPNQRGSLRDKPQGGTYNIFPSFSPHLIWLQDFVILGQNFIFGRLFGRILIACFGGELIISRGEGGEGFFFRIMEWLGRLFSPVRNGGFKVAARFGYRKSGVFKLHQDVRTCEYEDVHILWDMLQKNEKDLVTRSPEEARKGHFRNIFDWAKRPQSLCNRGV